MRYLSKKLKCFMSHLEKGSTMAKPMAVGSRVPVVAKMKVVTEDSPNLIPSGIANFSSTRGVIAANSTFISGLMSFI